MQFPDLFILSLKNVSRAGMRTRLCVLAICIGITSVTTVLGFGRTAEQRVAEELDQIGIRGLAFYTKSGSEFPEDAIDVIAQTEGVSAVMPLSLSTGSLSLRTLRSSAGILGVNEQLSQVFHLELLHGTLPTIQQIRSAAKVVVIEDTLAQQVYSRTNIVGKSIYISAGSVYEKMEICGVIRSQSESFSTLIGTKLPYLVYLPYTTLQMLTPNTAMDKTIASVDRQQPGIEQAVLKKLNQTSEEEYLCENLDQYVEGFTNITAIVSVLISGIAAISVIVGGIGVMNAMVSAVDARTREIGIYRALGAKKRDIVGTYLLEAIILCLTGGIYGILLDIVIFQLIERVSGIPLELPTQCICISLCAAVFCGIVFGLLPAVRAAKLDPIQAIRME